MELEIPDNGKKVIELAVIDRNRNEMSKSYKYKDIIKF